SVLISVVIVALVGIGLIAVLVVDICTVRSFLIIAAFIVALWIPKGVANSWLTSVQACGTTVISVSNAVSRAFLLDGQVRFETWKSK
ncbi:1183_t:CDS:2, partial [Ambispora leptoticha]